MLKQMSDKQTAIYNSMDGCLLVKNPKRSSKRKLHIHYQKRMKNEGNMKHLCICKYVSQNQDKAPLIGCQLKINKVCLMIKLNLE